MAERKKKRYDAARTKEMILNAAEEMFAAHEFSATRIDTMISLTLKYGNARLMLM
ncbi:hypothetical protein BBR47_30460 [Brevibacillus brevis NBRC 100599]|uniref:Uncharacterized protein n=1 Tax=Brevibacillus brevis (strain 47 / JCM 6285 / NBRC 100599) TaxID=358681 RepID=C0ZE14_BREBN|nr:MULTISPECIES: hypothetical protein [Bacillales]BAH44023.1 hypothetical protein BBR47_30460 [Brevibacillus brevis NBRC 100599]